MTYVTDSTHEDFPRPQTHDGTAPSRPRPDAPLDRLARLAVRSLNVPFALLSLDDARRQVCAVRDGVTEPWDGVRETPLSRSLCRKVTASGEPLVLDDIVSCQRGGSEATDGERGMSAFLGVPLWASEGRPIGAFCVADARPRRWSEADIETLEDLAASVGTEIRLEGEILRHREISGHLVSIGSAAAVANCLLWRAEIRDTGEEMLIWDLKVLNEETAQRFLPLEVPPGRTYSQMWFPSVLPEDLPRIDRQGDRSVREGKSYTQEFRCRRKDGATRWLKEAVEVERIATGRWRAVGVCVDVTEQKSREEERKQILRGAKCLIWDADISETEGNYHWLTDFFDEEMAQQVFPLPLEPGQTYAKARYWNKHPEDRARNGATFREAIRNGAPSYTQDFRAYTPAGEERWLHEVVTLERRGPHLWHAVGVCTDISDLIHAEERIAFQASLLGQVRNAVVALDLEERVVYWNSYAETLYGWTSEEALGQKVPFTPDSAHDEEREIRERLAADGHWEGETTVRRKDGSVFPALVALSALHGPQGEVTGYIGISTDISERKRTEEALQQSERQLRAMFDEASIGMALVDLRGYPFRVNAALQRMLGYTEEELLRKEFAEVTHPEDVSKSWERAREVISGVRDGYEIEKRYLRKDGSVLWGHLSVSMVRDESGRPQFAVSMIQDLTERKSLESQLVQSQKMEAVGRLAGGVAHDFNNMLSVINGYSELALGRMPPGDGNRNALTQILRAGQHAAELTKQLLAFSRKQVLAPKVMDLGEQAVRVSAMLDRLIGEDVRLEKRIGPGLWKVEADPGQMEQVLINLAVNARDAMPDGGELTLEIANREVRPDGDAGFPPFVPPGCYVALEVSDTGAGIGEEIMGQIFEPFFTTKSVGKGTGLGLATVYGIVKQSGGYVWAENRSPEGAKLTVLLPRAGEDSAEEDPPAPAQEDATGTETVLVVEDQEMVREVVRETLRGCGYRLLEAADGDSALKLLREYDGPIHLLVTDVVMPGEISGPVLADHAARIRPETKVLFMSGYTDDAVIRRGVQTDTLNFLQKPFSPSELAHRLRELSDGTQGTRTDPD